LLLLCILFITGPKSLRKQATVRIQVLATNTQALRYPTLELLHGDRLHLVEDTVDMCVYHLLQNGAASLIVPTQQP